MSVEAHRATHLLRKGASKMPNANDNLIILMQREDGTTYDFEASPDQDVRLVNGHIVKASELRVFDEIKSHHSIETSGTGHFVLDFK